MIKKIFIENINSIKKTEISFEKCRYKFLEDNVSEEGIVYQTAFYGANGSGKSSILNAFDQLVGILTNKPDDLNPFTGNFIHLMNTLGKIRTDIGNENIDNNKYNELISSITSTFVIEFITNNIEFEYTLQTHPTDGIINEKLLANNKLIFKKEDTKKYIYLGNEYLLDSSMFSVLRKIYSTNLDSSNEIANAYNYLSNIAIIDANRKNYFVKDLQEKKTFDLIVEKSDEVRNILKEYNDFPIYSIRSTEKMEATDIKKKYEFYIECENRDYPLSIEFLSDGMFDQSFLLSVLLTLPKNGVMVIDEIENALHPLTILNFIKEARKRNIQLIFSTHNTFILQSLRPDQVFFANWRNGYSSYKRLADVYPNIREINNIEKMYLSNLFTEDIKKDE